MKKNVGGRRGELDLLWSCEHGYILIVEDLSRIKAPGVRGLDYKALASNVRCTFKQKSQGDPKKGVLYTYSSHKVINGRLSAREGMQNSVCF